MTTQKPELMPDEIFAVNRKDFDTFYSDSSGRVWHYDMCDFPEYEDEKENHSSYTRTDLYTAACAERDALRDFQAEIVRVYFDPTISEIETQSAIHRMMTEAKDRVRQHEKHRAGE